MHEETDDQQPDDIAEQTQTDGYSAYTSSAYVWQERDFEIKHLDRLFDDNTTHIRIRHRSGHYSVVEKVRSLKVYIEDEPDTAPAPSAYLAEFLTPTAKATDFVANLEEARWGSWVKRYGERRARILWYAQIGHFVLAHWLGVALDVIKLMPKT